MVFRKEQAMRRIDVIRRALAGELTWWRAASICGLSIRHMQRLRERYEKFGIDGLEDRRTGREPFSRIGKEVVEELCRLKKEMYPDFSIRHFHEFVTERHKLRISYSWTRIILQARGLADPAARRGKYRRRRERRPMVGMMMHCDGSTHEWIAGLPPQDLVIMLDDATTGIGYARFWRQEGTMSTLHAVQHVVQRSGRFCEFYTDRGSHFCRTTSAGQSPDAVQDGQVARVLRALGIRQILARSPEARGRCERAFETIQGRLPQELRVAEVRTYEQANEFLERHFIPDFNRRFAVQPLEEGSAFVPVIGLELELLFSVQHERVVRKDNTVQFQNTVLQLSPTAERNHFVRCPVLVHEFLDGTLGVSYHGQVLRRFQQDGRPISGRTDQTDTVVRRATQR